MTQSPTSSTTMRFVYDDRQSHQISAIESIVELLQDVPRQDSGFALPTGAVANLPEEQLQDYAAELSERMAEIQKRNNVVDPRSAGQFLRPEVEFLTSSGLNAHVMPPNAPTVTVPHFSIEMETGTGKTYVYLRTIYALRQTYGFGKFVIVVPSIAIYEGVKAAFNSMRVHLQQLYNNERCNLIEYDGEKLSKLREYETQRTCDILLMTVDSFNKCSNLIFKSSEKLPGGRLPINYIQSVQPVVILDEPQNMESDTAQKAIHTLNPLCVLRYSATHRNAINVMYQLRPFDALRMGLVKRVQVIGLTSASTQNDTQPMLLGVTYSSTKKPTSARVEYPVIESGIVKRKAAEFRLGQDVYAQASKQPIVADGWRINDFGKRDGREFVSFQNGQVLYVSSVADVQVRREIFRQQIHATIDMHIRRQAVLEAQGIKVLSLFFIDKVASYRGNDDEALVRTIFAQEFARLQDRYARWRGLSAENVSAAYFAADKSGALTDDEKKMELKREYQLIMHDKENMLSFAEPKCFIIAHSALKEGWDNPNVFQICTLRETQSELRKRQEIGRGLRICVNQSGERVFGDDVNILTVVANESYELFVQRLQTEMDREGLSPDVVRELTPQQVMKPINRRTLSARDAQYFDQFWAKAARRITANIRIDDVALLREGQERLRNTEFPEPRIVLTKGEVTMARVMVTLNHIDGYGATISLKQFSSRQTDDIASDVRVTLGQPLVSTSIDLPELRMRTIEKIDSMQQMVLLSTGESLYVGVTVELFHGGVFKPLRHEEKQVVSDVRYPIIDFPKRVGDELQLSHHMIRELFAAIPLGQRVLFFQNPEGFTSTFLDVMRDVLRAHVVQRLSFTVHDDLIGTITDWFPATVEAVQKKLVDTSQRSVYDKTPIDSGVEERFVAMLEGDDEVLFYFKFPHKYKLDFPEVIGNYNPDWAVVRRGPRNEPELYLVRETKGSENIENLRFVHEKHKIRAAYRCFAELGLDYRVVSDTTNEWWHPRAIQDQVEEVREVLEK